MDERCLVVMAMLAVSRVLTHSLTYPPPVPLIRGAASGGNKVANTQLVPFNPEAAEFLFEINASDPRYSDFFTRDNRVMLLPAEGVQALAWGQGRRAPRSLQPLPPSGRGATATSTCPGQQSPAPCGMYTLSGGQCLTFSSQNFPSSYPDSFSCAWQFNAASAGQELQMVCSDFHLAGGGDKLKIDSDGSGYVKYKKKNAPPPTTTTGGVLIAVFGTDTSGNAMGFKCVVTNTGSTPTTTTTTSTTTTTPTTTSTTTTTPTTTSTSTTTPTTTSTSTTTPTTTSTTTTTPTTTEGRPPLSHPQCGQRKARIINGEESIPHQHPWQVWLMTVWIDRRARTCGGTIFHEQWILTAAHCVTRYTHRGSTIRVAAIRGTFGAHLKSNPGAHGGYNVYAAAYGKHKSYAFPAYDVALVWFRAPLTFTPTVAPVCLAPRAWRPDDFVQDVLTISGWGRTETGSAASSLQEMQTTGITIASCRAKYGSRLHGSILCTHSSSKKVCVGDGGGPVTVQRSGLAFQVGLVSFGARGCSKAYPDGHGRVAYFIGWIESVTGLALGI